MRISPNSLGRFLSFLEKTADETYPEEPSTFHDAVTARAMEDLFTNFPLPAGARILDIGCGQGVALKPFHERGFTPIGITLNATDVDVCRKQGFDVRIMDQSFLDFEDACFDMLWARHVLEHSIMPLYTLTEFRRVLRPGGVMYLEVPAPDTLLHERNPNHYSVLGKTMWTSLLERSGFMIVGGTDYFGETSDGRPDEYWGFFAQAAHEGNVIR